MRNTLLRIAKRIGNNVPALQRISGKLGIGRLLAPTGTVQRVTVDGDILVELDMSVPIFRYIYLHHDLSKSLETVAFRQLLRTGDNFVDVGAHIGYVSLLAAKYSANVVAVEPAARTVGRLRHNMSLNPRLAPKITVHQCALSSKKGERMLYGSNEHPGRASLMPIDAAALVDEQVVVQTLDDLLRDSSLKAHAIKVDVEGAELDVFAGASETLRNHGPLIFVELIESLQQRFGRTVHDVINHLTSFGYDARWVWLAGGKVCSAPIDYNPAGNSEITNAIFFRAEHADRIAGLGIGVH